MTYVPPGVTTITTGAVAGAGTLSGLVVAIAGAAPTGPSAPTPISNRLQGQLLFGDERVYTDFGGWTIPEAISAIYDNNLGNAPIVLVCRAGTTPASVVLPNGGSTTGTWTATALGKTFGGTSGAGMTLQYSSTANTFTVVPPSSAPATVLSEIYENIPASATWAQIAAIVNARSSLVSITITGSDGPASAATTLATTAGGTDGQNATVAQINSAIDNLMNLDYGTQPIHYIVPLAGDDGTNGVTLHALSDAEAMLGNGSYQRPQVIGSSADGMSVAALQTLLATLVPTENGGDSGRCSFMTNWSPWALDPALNQQRKYPGWFTACAYAGECASLPPATPRGRLQLRRITRCNEGYAYQDRVTLLAAGGMTATPQARFMDQVTTATLSSYRREPTVQTQEDVWVGLLQWTINTQAVEMVAGGDSGQYLDNIVGLNLLGYAEQGLMASSSHDTFMLTNDARDWEVDVSWVPILPLRNVTLRTFLSPPQPSTATAVATF